VLASCNILVELGKIEVRQSHSTSTTSFLGSVCVEAAPALRAQKLENCGIAFAVRSTSRKLLSIIDVFPDHCYPTGCFELGVSCIKVKLATGVPSCEIAMHFIPMATTWHHGELQ